MRNAQIVSNLDTICDQRIHFVVSDDSSCSMKSREIQEIANAAGIKYVKGPCEGAVANWNSCLNSLATDYAIFLHHDEYPARTSFYLALLDSLRLSNDTDLMLLQLLKSRHGRLHLHYPIFLKNLFLRFAKLVFSVNPFGSPSVVVFHKRILEYFDIKLMWYVDVDWYYRLLSRSHKTVLSNNIIISDLDFNESITKSLDIRKVKRAESEYLVMKYRGKLFLPIFFEKILKFPILICKSKSVYL